MTTRLLVVVMSAFSQKTNSHQYSVPLILCALAFQMPR